MRDIGEERGDIGKERERERGEKRKSDFQIFSGVV